METAEQRERRGPHEEAVMDPWAQAHFFPHDLFEGYPPLEAMGGGAISDMNLYRSITPEVSPMSSNDGLSGPNRLDRVMLDIGVDIVDDSWTPFGSFGTNELFDASSLDAAGGKVNDDLKLVNSPPREVEIDPTLSFGSQPFTVISVPSMALTKSMLYQHQSDLNFSSKAQHTPSLIFRSQVTGLTPSSNSTSLPKPRRRASRPKIETGCNNCK
jgi:hypothetical protein